MVGLRRAGVMKFGFDHVHLVGSDLDASERFYRELFRLRPSGDAYEFQPD
jgi:catechol 2,3-dioxygenase-like lactoylglutathione lyase family enzyme